ncbi:glutathione-disulfide reductase [Alcanivorax sp. JB21]|nr:glutathione-disulfide reductase [Alcanivorax limicola]MBZ2187924.1 glutathione-disulfide reductase [Alcanivorax limicola]
MADTFDLIVIGAGSGGVRAARMAAAEGARVAIIESRFFGGTCVNVGCVPKKLFAYASEFADLFQLAEDYGFASSGSAPSRPDWQRLRDNKTREIERLNGIYRRMLEQAGVTIFEAHGRVLGAGRVSAGEQQLSAKNILVATGGQPFVPDIPGKALALISDDLFYLPELPKTVAVVGGGYIATEFASILNGLGVSVQQIYRGGLFMRGFDEDIRAFVAAQMAENGVNLRFNCDVMSIDAVDGQKQLTLADGETLRVDEVFYATGRVPNVTDLFADELGLALADNGAIPVDAGYATSVPGLYALGDVTDRVQLTPVALAEGTWLAKTLFATDKPDGPLNYENIATAVFCHPNIGTVGLTETQALECYDRVRIYTSEFRPLRYSMSPAAAGSTRHRTLMKLVVDDASDRVVGLHMAGDEAGEIVQGFAVAINMGATKADFDRTLGIHPTSAEEFVTMRTLTRTCP